jgi:signal transduction histidine kinase
MTLVFEDPGGEPLDRLLGRPLEVEPFLRIAVPLAAAIGQVHARGLIHKDLKPSNILVDMASGGVWLTGFGIASRLPREHHIAEPPEVIAGTLAYMAPEQTGRMNRSVGEALDDLRRDTCEITDDVHRLSYRLHSSTLDYLGLVPALQKLVTEFGERHNIAITFMHASVPPYLPPEVALCLFRVAEESLTNIAKHSQARSATVQVTGEPDGTHLTVEDAGTGFDMPALGSKVGLGFVSMRERLRVVHGTLQVDSAPSQGTRIDAWVPLTIVTSAHTRHETTPDPAGRRP